MIFNPTDYLVYVAAENALRERHTVPVAERSDIMAGKTAVGHYVLVEFGDYQCNPCITMFPQVVKILRRHNSKLNFVFHQLPLPIHKYSHNAALLAEEARLLGKFDQVHNALFTGGIRSEIDVETISKEYGITENSEIKRKAAEKVTSDVGLAKKLHISGTPAFFLCRPDGSVVKILRPSQVDVLL